MWWVVIKYRGYPHFLTNAIGQPFRFTTYEDAIDYLEKAPWPKLTDIEQAWITDSRTHKVYVYYKD